MANAEQAHAASKLASFLQSVGPVEAIWAMSTALQALEDLPGGEDHVAAVTAALHSEQEPAIGDRAEEGDAVETKVLVNVRSQGAPNSKRAGKASGPIPE
jgi:hypothetical protein